MNFIAKRNKKRYSYYNICLSEDWNMTNSLNSKKFGAELCIISVQLQALAFAKDSMAY